MGSGGALLALYLAKSGVKEFIFIDDDRIETHNIIRHICDMDNLGRFKTLAVKDFIEARIPDVKIKTVEGKFDLHTKADFDFYCNLLGDVDLIAAVSGEHDVNYAINDFIHSNQFKIPLIFAGTFDGVKGGLIFKVDPQIEDYCYHCIYSKPDKNGSIKTKAIPTTIELEQKISYDRTLQEQLAQPGLGLDIDNLTIFLAKFSLDILLTGEEHGLYHFPFNFYMWFNRTIMTADESSVKYEGLELYYYEDLEKDPDCPFHGAQALKTLEMKKKKQKNRL
jgi:molybdopterin/thiamine biosynthesis adenylyltransferase